MAKQHRGNKPRAVIGTHHGLMHGSQSHQQHFNRSSRGGSLSNSTNISPKGSTRSSFSTFTTINFINFKGCIWPTIIISKLTDADSNYAKQPLLQNLSISDGL